MGKNRVEEEGDINRKRIKRITREKKYRERELKWTEMKLGGIFYRGLQGEEIKDS